MEAANSCQRFAGTSLSLLPVSEEFKKIFAAISLKKQSMTRACRKLGTFSESQPRAVADCMNWNGAESLDEFSLAARSRKAAAQSKKGDQYSECICPECFFFNLGASVGELSSQFMEDLLGLPLNSNSLTKVVTNIRNLLENRFLEESCKIGANKTFLSCSKTIDYKQGLNTIIGLACNKLKRSQAYAFQKIASKARAKADKAKLLLLALKTFFKRRNYQVEEQCFKILQAVFRYHRISDNLADLDNAIQTAQSHRDQLYQEIQMEQEAQQKETNQDAESSITPEMIAGHPRSGHQGFAQPQEYSSPATFQYGSNKVSPGLFSNGSPRQDWGEQGYKQAHSGSQGEPATREQTPGVTHEHTRVELAQNYPQSSGIRTYGGYTSAGSPDSYAQPSQRKPLGNLNLNTSTNRGRDSPQHQEAALLNTLSTQEKKFVAQSGRRLVGDSEKENFHVENMYGMSSSIADRIEPIIMTRNSQKNFENGSASSAERFFLRHDSKSKDKISEIPASLAQSFGLAEDHHSPPMTPTEVGEGLVAAIKCSPVTLREPGTEGYSFHSLNAGPPTSRYGPASSPTVAVADSVGLNTNGNTEPQQYGHFGSHLDSKHHHQQSGDQKRYASMQIHHQGILPGHQIFTDLGQEQSIFPCNSRIHAPEMFSHSSLTNQQELSNKPADQTPVLLEEDIDISVPTLAAKGQTEASSSFSRERGAIKSIRLKSLQKIDREERSRTNSSQTHKQPTPILQTVLQIVRGQNSRRSSVKATQLVPVLQEASKADTESFPQVPSLKPVPGFTKDPTNAYGSPRVITCSRVNRTNTSASVAHNESEMEDRTQTSQAMMTSPSAPMHAEFSASTGMKKGYQTGSRTKEHPTEPRRSKQNQAPPAGSIAEVLNGLQTDSQHSRAGEPNLHKTSLLRSPELNQFMMTATLTSNNTDKELARRSVASRERKRSESSPSKGKKEVFKGQSREKSIKLSVVKGKTGSKKGLKGKKSKSKSKKSKKSPVEDSKPKLKRLKVKSIGKKLKKLSKSRSRSVKSRSQKSAVSKGNSISSAMIMVRQKRPVSSTDLRPIEGASNLKTQTVDLSSTLRSKGPKTPVKAGISPAKSLSLKRSRSRSLPKLNQTENLKNTSAVKLRAAGGTPVSHTQIAEVQPTKSALKVGLTGSVKVKTSPVVGGKSSVGKATGKDLSVRELKPSASYDRYYQEKHRVLEQSQKKQNRVINSIVDLFMQRHRESEKRKRLVEKLEQSISIEKQILNRSSELSKQHISEQLMKSFQQQTQRLNKESIEMAATHCDNPLAARLSHSKSQLNKSKRSSVSQSVLLNSSKVLLGKSSQN